MASSPIDPVLVADHDGARGIATSTPAGWEIDLVAGSGRLDVPVATDLIQSLDAQVRAGDGRTVRWRVPEPTPEHHAIARATGFDGTRTLWQMRRPLPADPPDPPIEVRPFDPELDDSEWLRVNNSAFSWHPEQGGWDVTLLHERLAEPWVDLDGFLVHPADDDADQPGDPIDGFCWTKVHGGTDPLRGEIYVIAVDPAASGTGLGRRLVLAGLQWLHLRGCEVGTLYTESDNDAAVGLYRSLGFDVHHEVRVFTREA